jgi:hypothetical protein
MQESRPNTHGWVDRGAAPQNTFDRFPDITGIPSASACRTVNIDGEYKVTDALSEEDVRLVHKQGRELPRMLSLEESRRARRNRLLARDVYTDPETSGAS